jgi:hypothetical protein
MLKQIFLATVITFSFSDIAKADPGDPLLFYSQVQNASPIQKAKEKHKSLKKEARFSVPRFIRGRLVCAVNVNAALSHRGIKGTGSARAFDFLSWGKASHPTSGAVRVSARRGGGHVMIVSHMEDGEWLCLNPSASKQQWRVVPCNTGPRALAYRIG